ncbi:MAG TPA: SIR2 family protein [Gemmatimonadaceae bacterium]|nr:SIR2 family protein [Gemmatimonadaceae bacterium]
MLELPKELAKAAEERRLLPFIGAGFSKNIDPSIPNWSEIMEKAAHLLGYDPAVLMAQGDHLQIAEYVREEGFLPELYNQLSKEIDGKPYDVALSKPHQLLPYLDVPWIFTTNWDTWIEKGFWHEGVACSRIVSVDHFVSPRQMKPSGPDVSKTPQYTSAAVAKMKRRSPQTTVVKFHGDFTDHNSIVFCEEDYYNRLDFEDPLDIKLRAEIIGRAVVFIGYSFSDPNVRYIWHKLKRVTKRMGSNAKRKSFFITNAKNPVAERLFQERNIETVLLDPLNTKGDLERVLLLLIERQSP